MIGSVVHDVECVAQLWDENPTLEKRYGHWQDREPFVQLSNSADGHYWQGFESHAEVEEFIEKLRAVALEAFGPLPTIPLP